MQYAHIYKTRIWYTVSEEFILVFLDTIHNPNAAIQIF